MNRRLKRKDEKIKSLSVDIEASDNKVKDAEIEIEQYKTDLQELVQELGKIKSQKVTEQKAKHYWKQKASSLTAESDVGGEITDISPQDATAQISNMENENLELKDLIPRN